jgi:hypothetical protein
MAVALEKLKAELGGLTELERADLVSREELERRLDQER